MAEPLTLIGFEHSVYTRIARMALVEMGLEADYVEANPFAEEPDPELTRHTPFGRVPVLRHGGFTLTETGAILRYLDRMSAGPSLIPQDARAAARMDQVIGIVDAYVYLPLIRKVFAHGFYAPRVGAPFDPDQVVIGLDQGGPALRALDRIAGEAVQLNGADISLADLHLAPMIDYLVRVPEGAAAVADHRALAAWWARLRARASLRLTDPFEVS